MQSEYKKECYDSNPNYKIHYSYGIKVSKSTLNYFHYDKDFIIEYYRKGEASLHVEGNIYNITNGDIVILNPDELHVTIRNNDCYIEKICLHINDSLLSQFNLDRTVFLDTIAHKAKGKGNLIPNDSAKKLGISDNLDRCLELVKENSLESQVLITCKIIEVLSEISKLVKTSSDVALDTASSNKKVNQIIDYINRHYTEEITLDDLSKRFYFSKYYISHLFKDYVGVSLYDYLIIRRLYNCNDLIRAKFSVKEACFKVGFNNYSNFYRLYKKHFKITPQQFKEQLTME